MSDSLATIAGFAVSFAILFGYGFLLTVAHLRVRHATGRGGQNAARPGAKRTPTESVTTELKPRGTIKAS